MVMFLNKYTHYIERKSRVKLNKKEIIIILLALLIILHIITIIRIFDLKQMVYITHDAWLNFFGLSFQTIGTIIGLLITIHIFLYEKSEKERPIVIIKPSSKERCQYECKNNEEEYTLNKKVYIEVINDGNVIMKNPQIRTESGKILSINKLNEYDQLKLIEPHKYNIGNDYIVSIEINYYEGMKELVSRSFELLYENENNISYKIKFSIEIRRHDPDYFKVYYM